VEGRSAVSVVALWQEAANERDFERLAGLPDPEIPRGSGYGHGLLRGWLVRAGLTLETRRIFAAGGVVFAGQHGVWRSVETGEFVGEGDVASCFRLTGGRVVYVSRHDDLETALEEAGLAYSDELSV
jgi:hypothetical protein